MSDGPRRLTTDLERERLHAAKGRGGLCVACGRVLDDGEPVYIERVVVDRKPLAATGVRWSACPAYRDTPLGAECASPGFLARARGWEPERCAGCGRPVYCAVAREGCRWATCSHRCAPRAGRAGGRRGSAG